MIKKRVLTVLMALIMIISFDITALADDISDKEQELQQKIGDSQGKISNLNNTIESLEEKILSGQKQANELENSISEVDGDIKDMQKKITDLQSRIDVTTKELNAAIQDYNLQDERMKNRINALYKNGTSVGYLEVILEATSFSDFMTKADILKKIVNYDVDMLKEMKQKREEINNKKLALDKDKSDMVALKNSLDGKKVTLVTQNKEKKSLIALLSRDKSNYESMLKQEQSDAEMMKRELSTLRTYKGKYTGEVAAILHSSDFPSGKSPRITSPFGYRTDPITGQQLFHSGLDIGTALVKNIPVYAMAAGKVILAKYYGGYGNAVVIDHGSGLTTLYGHNNTLLVSVGAMVKAGQKIALSGSTGRSTGPHVHFEIEKDGEYQNPADYYWLGN